MRPLLVLLAAGAIAGCGSAGADGLPAAAAPDPLPVALGAGREARLHTRARRLTVRSRGRTVAGVAVGVGPSDVAGGPGGRLFVADRQGEALLVVQTRPRLQVVRRVHLPGPPRSVDRVGRRLVVALDPAGRTVELPAHGRPHVLP